MNRKYKDLMYYKFCAYGFLKNQRYYEIFFILFLRSIGFSFLQIGLLISIREISIQLLEIPTGVMADVFGRRRSMIISFVSYIISLSIFYISKNFLSFSIAMILFAFGETFRSGTHKAMIMQYLDIKNMKDKKLEYYGSTRSCSQLGSALSAIIAAILAITLSNYRSAFLFTILVYIVELLLLSSYPKFLEGDTSKSKHSSKFVYEHLKRSFRNIMKKRELLKLLVNSSMSKSSFSIAKEYLQPIIKAQALSLGILLWMDNFRRTSLLIGILYFFIYLFSSWASKNAYKLADKIGNGNVLRSANILYLINAIAILIAGISFNFSILWISIGMFFIFYFINNSRRPMIVSYFGDIMEKNERATILSIESLTTSLITSVMAIVVGFMADRLGIGNAFIVFGLLITISIPIITLRKKS